MKRYDFEKTTNAFIFVFEQVLPANETIMLKMPRVSANKRGVNDIGWQCDGDVTLLGTLSRKPECANALWQEINPNDELNHTISALKIVNNGGECNFVARVLLN